MIIIFIELYIAVPLGIAFYPWNGTIKATNVEPHIREWKNKDGRHLEEF